MNILMGWLTPVKVIFLYIDTIAFSLVDDCFDLLQIFAKNQVFGNDAFNSLMNNIYVLVGVIAFFRLAMLLVNSIIEPDNLLKKKEGLSSIFGRTVIMLVLLIIAPIIFKELGVIQSYVVDNNVIFKVILGNNASTEIETSNSSQYFSDAGKTMQKIVITSLIKPEDEFFVDGEKGVTDYLNNKTIANDSKNGPTALVNAGYVDTSICKKNCQKAMAQYHQMISESAKGGFKLRRLGGYVGGSSEVEILGSNEDSEDLYYYEYTAGVTTITAIFLTYVLLSWSIDIAIRSVELAVLRLISPLFIATIVDPKSTSSGGYFNNWLKRYGKTYADLFLKLAIISLAILMISLIQDAEIWNTVIGG